MSDVQERVRAAATRWNLTVGDRLSGGTRSAVFAARDSTGGDVVLKLPDTRAGTGDAVTLEAAALSAWSGTGAAVTLIDATRDAVLLELVRPGRPMLWAADDSSVSDRVEIAAELLQRLWGAEVTDHDHRYPAAAAIYPGDERTALEDAVYEQQSRSEPERGMPGVQRLPAARAAAGSLFATMTDVTLLHGDFITKNLVSSSAGPVGWLSIDPLPRLGEPAIDAAAFAAYHPAELIFTIAEQLARRAQVPLQRCLAWTTIDVIHQTAQAWRDDQEELEELARSRTVADLLTPLL